MTTLCTVPPPQLHHSAAAAPQLHQSCQLRRALCRPAAARPGRSTCSVSPQTAATYYNYTKTATPLYYTLQTLGLRLAQPRP